MLTCSQWHANIFNVAVFIISVQFKCWPDYVVRWEDRGSQLQWRITIHPKGNMTVCTKMYWQMAYGLAVAPRSKSGWRYVDCCSAAYTDNQTGIQILRVVYTDPQSGIKILRVVYTDPQSGIKILSVVYTDPQSGIKILRVVYTDPQSGIKILRVVCCYCATVIPLTHDGMCRLRLLWHCHWAGVKTSTAVNVYFFFFYWKC